MDFIIWIIILVVVNSLFGGKKKKKPGQTTPQAKPKNIAPPPKPAAGGGLGGLMRELMQDMQSAAGTGRVPPKPKQQQQRARRAAPALTPIEKECDYCAGTNPLGEPLRNTAAPIIAAAQPVVPIDAANGGSFVDMGAVQKNLRLSDAQNAVLWQELLDKPLALRRRR